MPAHRDALESVIILTEKISDYEATINILTGRSVPRIVSQLEKLRDQLRQDRAILEQQLRASYVQVKEQVVDLRRISEQQHPSGTLGKGLR